MGKGPEQVPFNERERATQAPQIIIANTDAEVIIGMEILDTKDINPRIVFTAIVVYASYDETEHSAWSNVEENISDKPLVHDVMIQRLVRRDNKPSGEISNPILYCEVVPQKFLGSTAMALDYGKTLYEDDHTRRKAHYAKRAETIEKEVEAMHTFLEGDGINDFLDSVQEKPKNQNEMPPRENGEAN